MKLRAITTLTTLVAIAAFMLAGVMAQGPTDKPEPKAPTVETPGAGDNPTVEQTEADKELDALIEKFVKGDEAAIKAAHDALLDKGTAAVDKLFPLKTSEDKVLAERATALLKEMGLNDDNVYAQLALFRPQFTPGELIGLRVILKNYQKDTITVFSPTNGLVPGLGLKLTLINVTTNKAVDKVDLNAKKIQANTPLQPTAFLELKPGEKYEDVVELHELFDSKGIAQAKYKLTGWFTDKSARTASLTKLPPTTLNNFYPGEVELKPLEFAVAATSTPVVTPAQTKQIKDLIEKLGDNSYKVRIQAEKDLEKMGVVVLPFLRDARENHKDLQVRETAYKIIQLLDIKSKQQNTYIGINLRGNPKGVEASIVEKGSPADKGGMQVGDVIVKVNGESIPGKTDQDRNNNLIKRIRYRTPGEEVKFTVLRGGKEIELAIVLGARLN